MESSSVRRRGPKIEPSPDTNRTQKSQAGEIEEGTDRAISLLDVLRIIITLFAVSCALSYYLTSGSSLFWNYNPWFSHPAQVLAEFNGTDPQKPIYLAINGTIFDVSAGRHTYGPGGSYEVFAGRDASRAFVTGCFLEDRTGDLRGAEEIYIPIDDPEEEITSGARKTRAEKERRDAKKRVLQEVRKWEEFYKNHPKYFEVGKVVNVSEYTGEPPKLCEAAQKGRPQRKNMKKADNKTPGKPVQ
ncbi:hypothetical protein HRR78_002860 [Exophiala dermatitidis]|nr:hypothetical protein HRR75_004780 [Exophiala dermatitidis]KAJ4554456.1 hypothetical protein HRR78_002860 [Exophiala dermatitidis]